MEILYIYVEGNHNFGVIKKIQGQIKALKSLGNNVDILNYSNKKMFLNQKEQFKAGNKYLKRFIIFMKLRKLELNKYDIIYLRSPGFNPCVIKFLKDCKKKYPRQKIILEIPTYPYDKEDFNIVTKIYNYIDRISRKNINKYIDKIVTYSDDKKIFDVSCINISNGIDLKKIDLIEKKEHDCIVFTSVSLCFFWHGIDRFINSLLKYIKNGGREKIKFNIVGEGVETSKLKMLVKNNIELKDIVIFHGVKLEKELKEIYDETDIAVGSLGRHRSGVYTMKALKNREYASKGLPMIFSENDLDFEKVNFVYKVIPDDSLINIEDILKWYKNLKISHKEIRKFSEKFSWNIQMKKVIDEINKI